MKSQQTTKCRATLAWATAPLLIASALIVATPASSGQPSKPRTDNYNGSATLTAVGDEPNASGVAKLHATVTFYQGWGWGNATLRLTCAGLTPGASYTVTMVDGVAIADAKGNLTISIDLFGVPDSISVYRVEPTGNVIVLSGVVAWHPQWH